MAENQEIASFDIDIRQIIEKSKAIQDAIKAMGTSMKDVAVVGANWNPFEKTFSDVTLKSIDKQGKEVITRFRKIREEVEKEILYKTTTFKAGDYIAPVAAAERKRLLATTGNYDPVTKLRQVNTLLKNGDVRVDFFTTEKVTQLSEDFKAIGQSFKQLNAEPATKKMQEYAEKLRTTTLAARELDSTIRSIYTRSSKSTEIETLWSKLRQITATARTTSKFDASLQTPAFATATPAQLETYSRAVTAFASAAESTTLKTKDLNNVLKAVFGGDTTKQFTGEAGKLQGLAITWRKAFDEINASAEVTKTRLQASGSKGFVSQLFGGSSGTNAESAAVTKLLAAYEKEIVKLGLSEKEANAIATAHSQGIANTNTKYANLITILTQLELKYRAVGSAQREATKMDMERAAAEREKNRLEFIRTGAGDTRFKVQAMFSAGTSGTGAELATANKLLSDYEKEVIKLKLSEQAATQIAIDYRNNIISSAREHGNLIQILKNLDETYRKVGNTQRQAVTQNNKIIAEEQKLIAQEKKRKDDYEKRVSVTYAAKNIFFGEPSNLPKLGTVNEQAKALALVNKLGDEAVKLGHSYDELSKIMRNYAIGVVDPNTRVTMNFVNVLRQLQEQTQKLGAAEREAIQIENKRTIAMQEAARAAAIATNAANAKTKAAQLFGGGSANIIGTPAEITNARNLLAAYEKEVAKLGLSEQTATTIATAHHNNIAITNSRYAQLTTILTQLDAAYRKLGETQRAAILQDTKLNQQAEALAARKKLEEGARNAANFALQTFFGGASGLEKSGTRDEQDAVLKIIQQIQKETVKYNLTEENAVKIISDYSKGIANTNVELASYLTLLKQLEAQHKKVGAAQREATRQNNQITEARQFIEQIRTKEELAIPAEAKPLQAASIRTMYSELQAAIAKTKLSAADLKNILEGTLKGGGTVLEGDAVRIQKALLKIINAVKNTKGEINDLAKKLANPLAQTENVFTAFAARVSSILFSGLVYNVQQAFRQSLAEAKNFSKSLGEIQTITQKTNLSYDDLYKNISNLSNSFGLVRQDVSEGLYQTFSNQVGSATESLEFMAAASNLAITTAGSQADAINALSSVLKSYKLNTMEVTRVSSALFQAINVGRFRLSDIANSLGTVTPLAYQLGISFEEVMTALSVLTIQGTTPANALTYLRNLLVQLQKPSQEFLQFLKDSEYASSQAALAHIGFGGVLQKVTQAINVEGRNPGKMFTNIRSLIGELGLTGKNLETYNDYFKQISDSVPDYMNAVAISFENTGRKMEIELTKVKNYFGDWGASFNKTIIWITDNIVSMRTAIKVILPLMTYFITLWSFSKLVNIANGVNVLTFAVTSLKKAVIALFTFIRAHPILAVASIIAAVGVAVWDALKDVEERVKETNLRISENVKMVMSKYIVEMQQLADRSASVVLDALENEIQKRTEALEKEKRDLKEAYENRENYIKKLVEDEVKIKNEALTKMRDDQKRFTNYLRDQETERVRQAKYSANTLESEYKKLNLTRAGKVADTNEAGPFQNAFKDIKKTLKDAYDYEQMQKRIAERAEALQELQKTQGTIKLVGTKETTDLKAYNDRVAETEKLIKQLEAISTYFDPTQSKADRDREISAIEQQIQKTLALAEAQVKANTVKKQDPKAITDATIDKTIFDRLNRYKAQQLNIKNQAEIVAEKQKADQLKTIDMQLGRLAEQRARISKTAADSESEVRKNNAKTQIANLDKQSEKLRELAKTIKTTTNIPVLNLFDPVSVAKFMQDQERLMVMSEAYKKSLREKISFETALNSIIKTRVDKMREELYITQLQKLDAQQLVKLGEEAQKEIEKRKDALADLNTKYSNESFARSVETDTLALELVKRQKRELELTVILKEQLVSYDEKQRELAKDTAKELDDNNKRMIEIKRRQAELFKEQRQAARAFAQDALDMQKKITDYGIKQTEGVFKALTSAMENRLDNKKFINNFVSILNNYTKYSFDSIGKLINNTKRPLATIGQWVKDIFGIKHDVQANLDPDFIAVLKDIGKEPIRKLKIAIQNNDLETTQKILSSISARMSEVATRKESDLVRENVKALKAQADEARKAGLFEEERAKLTELKQATLQDPLGNMRAIGIGQEQINKRILQSYQDQISKQQKINDPIKERKTLEEEINKLYTERYEQSVKLANLELAAANKRLEAIDKEIKSRKEQLPTNIAKDADDLRQLEALLKQITSVKVSETKSPQTAINELESLLKNLPSVANFDIKTQMTAQSILSEIRKKAEEQIANLQKQKQIESDQAKMRAAKDLADAEKKYRKDIVNEILREQQELEIKIAQQNQKYKTLVETLEKAKADLEIAQRPIYTTDQNKINQRIANINAAETRVKEAQAAVDKFSTASARNLQNKYSIIIDKINKSLAGGVANFTEDELNTIEVILDKRKKETKDPTAQDKIQKQMDAIKNLRQPLSDSLDMWIKKLDEAAIQTQISTQKITTSVSDMLNQLREKLSQMDLRIRIKAEVPEGEQVEGHARGGLIEGQPGIDSIFTRVSAGEFVVNARDTSKFRNQLMAMNSGYEPNFAATSKNVNMGDIHIKLEGSPKNERDAQQIARSLRRLVLRGQAKF